MKTRIAPDRTGPGRGLTHRPCSEMARDARACWHARATMFFGAAAVARAHRAVSYSVHRSTGTGPRTEFTNFMDRGPDRFAPVRSNPVRGPVRIWTEYLSALTISFWHSKFFLSKYNLHSKTYTYDLLFNKFILL